MPKFRLVLCALALAAGGCNTSYLAAMRRGDTALAAGNRGEAVTAYRDACRLDPQSKACALAEQVGQDAVREIVAGAKGPCETGTIDMCLEALAPARNLDTPTPEFDRALASAGRRHIATCGEDSTDLDRVAERMACLLAPLEAIALPSYHDEVAAIGHASARTFLQAAEAARPDGARYVLTSVARCYDTRVESGAALSAFARSVAVPIEVTVDTSAVMGDARAFTNLCQAAAAQLGGRVFCGSHEDAAKRGIVFDMKIGLEAWRHASTRTVRSVQYVSGIRRDENPDYGPAERRYQEAQSAFQQIEQEALDRKARCDSYQTEAACNYYNAIVPTYNQRSQARADAAQYLDQTPRVIERKVVDTFHYNVDTHTWDANWSYQISGSGHGGAQHPAHYQDDTHVGFDAANLEADPLVPPAPGQVEAGVAAELAAIIARSASAAITKGATQQRQACPAGAWDAAALQCWARAEQLAGKVPTGADVLQRAGHGVRNCL